MTDTQQPPKIKFKKRNIKKKQLRGNNKSVDDSAATNAKIKSNDDLIKDDSNDHDEEEEEEEGALNTILAVERRRKLLNNRNRGVDSAILLKASKFTTTTTDNNNKTTITTVDNNKDLEERLKGTFAAGKLAGSNDMGGDDEGGILAKKHKLAMEEFIQSNLQQSGGIGKETTESSSNGEATSSSAIINNGGPITEDEKELFAELLSTSDLNTNNHQANNNASQSKLEGDVGAGGAMMMGSGIAEVALPISERLKTQKATEKAAMEYEKAQASRRRAPTGSSRHDGGNDDYDDQFPTAGGSTDNDVNVAVAHDLPMNFASGPGKRKRQEDVNVVSTTTTTTTTTSPKKNVATSQKEQSAIVSSSSAAYYSASSAGGSVQRSDVSTLGQSYSHNFQLHQQDWIAQRRDERQSEIDTLKIKQHADEAKDLATTGGGKERMGFEMARRAAKGEKNVRPSVPRGPNGESLMNEWDRKKGGTHNQRSNDDRVWKQFMQKNKR